MAQNLFKTVERMLTDGGAVEPNATIELYVAGTSTPLTVYSDRTLLVSAGTSVTADAAGVVPERWLANDILFKFVYKDASGTTKYTRDYANDDDVSDFGTGVSAVLAMSEVVFYPRASPYNATGNGSAYDDVAIAACIAAAKAAGGWVDGQGLTYRLQSLLSLSGPGVYKWRNITFKKDAITATTFEWAITITGADFGSAINLAANAAIGANTIELASASGVAANQKYLLISNASYNPDATGFGYAVASKTEWIRVAPTYTSGTVIPVSAPLKSSYATANTARIYQFLETTEIWFNNVQVIGGGSSLKQGGIKLNKCTIHQLDGRSTSNEYEGIAFNLCGFRSHVRVAARGANLAGFGYGCEVVGCDSPLVEIVDTEDCRHPITLGSSYQTTLPGGGGDHYILGRGGDIRVVSGPNSTGSVFDTHTGHVGGTVGSVTGSLTGGITQTFTASSSSGILLTYTTDMAQASPVTVSNSGGALPTGLSAGTTYYTIRVSSTTSRLATSLANASAGTAIAYTDAGTGTHTVTTSLAQEAVTVESHGWHFDAIKVVGGDLGLTIQNYGRPSDEPSPAVSFGAVDLGRGGISSNALVTIENRDSTVRDRFIVNVNNLQGDYPGTLIADAEHGPVFVHMDAVFAQARTTHNISLISTVNGQVEAHIGSAILSNAANSASAYIFNLEGDAYEGGVAGTPGAKCTVNGGILSTQQTAYNVNDALLRLSPDLIVTAALRKSISGIGRILVGDQPGENMLVNPSFQFNQEAPATNADDTYAHDAWNVLTQSNPVAVTTLTDPETGASYGARITQANAAAQRFGYSQILESRDTRRKRAKHLILSGRVRCSATTTIRYAVCEWTSTADSVTSDIVNDWTSSTFTAGNFFLGSNLNIIYLDSVACTANTWRDLEARASFIVGTSANNLIVIMWTDTTQAQNVTLDFNRMKLEDGRIATEYSEPDASVVYEAIGRCAHSFTVQSENGARHIGFPVPMRAAPSVTVGVGSAGSITAYGFELTHTSAAACTVLATARL